MWSDARPQTTQNHFFVYGFHMISLCFMGDHSKLVSEANFCFCFSIAASIHFLRLLSLQSLRAFSNLSISALITATSSGFSMTRSFTFTTTRSKMLQRRFPKLVRLAQPMCISSQISRSEAGLYWVVSKSEQGSLVCHLLLVANSPLNALLGHHPCRGVRERTYDRYLR